MSRQEQARLALCPVLYPSWLWGQPKGKGCSQGSQMAQFHLPVAPSGSWLSLKALTAVESFICSGARITGVLQVQNSLRQLHPVHLKVTLQVLVDSPQQLLSVYAHCLTAVFWKGRRDSCNMYSCLNCLGKKQHTVCPGWTENALSQC